MSKRKVFRESDDDLESDQGEDDVQAEESEEEVENETESDSDSDAPPEDVGFSQSKEAALQKVTEAIKSIKQQKQKLKDNRKQKDDTYKRQKQEKLDSLQKVRLSEDFLKSLKSSPVVEEPSEESRVDSAVSPTREVSDEEDVERSWEEEDDEDRVEIEDFLPLGTSRVKAVYIGDHARSALTSAEKAAKFREQHLYGQRISRQSFKSRQNMMKKRKVVH